MHVGGVQPDEERLAGLMLSFDEVFGRGDKLFVACFHSLAIERAGVFDPLLPYAAPARLFGRVVLGGGIAVQDPARAELVSEPFFLWIIAVLGIFFGVEVIQVSEELVEAVHRRQKLVQ